MKERRREKGREKGREEEEEEEEEKTYGNYDFCMDCMEYYGFVWIFGPLYGYWFVPFLGFS